MRSAYPAGNLAFLVPRPPAVSAARGSTCFYGQPRPYAHTPNKVKETDETWRESVLCSGYANPRPALVRMPPTERAGGIRVSDRRATSRRSRRNSPSVQTPIPTHALTAAQVRPPPVTRPLATPAQRSGVCLPRASRSAVHRRPTRWLVSPPHPERRGLSCGKRRMCFPRTELAKEAALALVRAALSHSPDCSHARSLSASFRSGGGFADKICRLRRSHANSLRRIAWPRLALASATSARAISESLVPHWYPGP
jgi:hypothetical protein